jgi:hypothetical protein
MARMTKEKYNANFRVRELMSFIRGHKGKVEMARRKKPNLVTNAFGLGVDEDTAKTWLAAYRKAKAARKMRKSSSRQIDDDAAAAANATEDDQATGESEQGASKS